MSSPPTPPADSSPGSAPDAVTAAVERQQCWECRRRRLVCDGTQPVCTKCRAARIVCPGYADKKPLTWLAPGQVMSRTRKKKSPNGPKSKAPGAPSKPCNGSKRRQQKAAAAANDSDEGSRSDSPEDALGYPRPVELRAEVCDIFEAMIYYNSHIYPDLAKYQLGPCGFLLPMIILEGVPPSITHTLVSVAVSHRIIQMADDPTTSQLVKPMWTRLYRHRDIAVREIARLVSHETKRKSIATIMAVYTLFFAMLQQSYTPSWRTHSDAFMSLIHLRGSYPDVIRDIPDMELSMMALCIVGIFANTTSPKNDQFQVATTPETIQLIQTFYHETYYPSVTCPPTLLTDIILINDLRSHAPSPETTRAAHLILARLESFSPETWSAAREGFHDDWLLLSSLYRAATALYAILSLQSSGALPCSSPELGEARARHARVLFALLEEAVAVPIVYKRMTWALVVAGVEAARASAEVQRWIGHRLDEMSRDQGAAAPRVARGVLEGFWARGGGGWDQCFAEPLCLVL
ncbi:fungal-specific transcription factor domain-containing protein [Parachaetomium inaequale]|uniref:Fungal-specific transcription factor domain-containing protein n=1 Tax=Parachaetomium inaequale TaxID=2588326 RepID=A0AAN6PAX1_9PEZI|nr:fungal-specific transcription factor domain-containing protein [Parachaetomium inaequale]